MAHRVAPSHVHRRYRILGPLGEGGLATAYRVWDEATEEERALKLVDNGALALLRHEFTLLAGLYHPRLVRVHDFGVFRDEQTHGGYYTADLVPGPSLAELIRPSNAAARRSAVVDALEGLAFLHGLGIRHGDFKPDNIIVDPQTSRATLIDLSCAARTDATAQQQRVSGTPAYMAPELTRHPHAPIDLRADLYAVGVTLRELDIEPALSARLTADNPAHRPSEVVDVIAALGATPEPPLGIAGRSPFLIGRQAELNLFETHFDSFISAAPGPRALVFHGPHGIGKSRLFRAMKWRAQQRCDVAELPAPVAPPHSDRAIRSLLRRAGANLDPRPPANADVLDSMLRAAAELELAPRPTTLFVEDAHTLPPADLRYLEAMLRSLTEESRLFIVLTTAAPVVSAPSVLAHELPPLRAKEINQWPGTEHLSHPRHVHDLERLTGGNPAYLEAAFRDLALGRLDEADLAGTPRFTGADHLAGLVASATAEERGALAHVLARGPTPTPPNAILDALAARGFLTRDPDGYRLARPADHQSIAETIGPRDMRAAYATVAEELTAEESSTATPWLLRSLLRAGRTDDAIQLFDRADPTPANSSAAGLRAWSDALLELTAAVSSAPILTQLARAQLRLGHPRRAIPPLARFFRKRPDAHARRVGATFAGTAYLHAERPDRAVRYLERALAEESTPPAETNRIVALLVRALNQTGDYTRAATLAQKHLAEESDPASDVALALASGLGIAATYLGDTATATQHLSHVAKNLSEERHPRDAARARSYLAILAFRSGNIVSAEEQYARAHAIARGASLHDMIPTVVLNLGTARQQLGKWGEAIALYERGHRIAIAIGRTHAQAILELNLANLFADVGLPDRATAMLARAESTIGRASIDHLEGHRKTIAAEIAVARGDWRAARERFEDAGARHERRGERREHAEALVNVAWTLLQPAEDGAPTDIETLLSQSTRLLDEMGATDVEARLEIVKGMLALAASEPDQAIAHFSAATDLARSSSLPLIVAEAQARLADASRQTASSAEDHRAWRDVATAARKTWNEVASGLPRAMRDALWRHPRRRIFDALRPTDERKILPPRARDAISATDSNRLRRVLELGAKVSASLSLDRVLEMAMDAAVELTGAERGFLLLAEEKGDGDPVRVVVARNVDRKSLGRGELEFSTTIAADVMRSGEAVLTLDAQGDARFAANRSVHAMRLKSVACVPVIARGRTLGALYLDNRFEHGRFREEDVGVVLTFAGHIAMAIRNARLHAALEENNRRLSAEKRRVERLSRGQARQIGALEQRVRRQQALLERRYDYAAISHRSAAMREVLDVLDRVIDSDLTILVEGESGTGKELIARAIHFNSPRKNGPFVSVNCGALTETLLESELFGHTRGAFTGADRDRIGLMVAAEGGTLLLDEVGELSPSMQVKLLRALQEREVRPLGAVDPVPLDVRVVCATNRHLRKEVADGRFREDLYYRLGVVELSLPPLRERQEDILPIARAMLRRNAEQAGNAEPELSRGAVRALLSYRWPGNVRQLENVLARAYVLSDRSTVNEAELDLSAAPLRRKKATSRDEFEREEAERIHDTLLQNRWNVSRTARWLGMPRNTLYRKMRRLGLRRD